MKLTADTYKIMRVGNKDVALFQKLIRLFNEVFETGSTVMPEVSYLIKLLKRKEFISFVIINGNEVIGGLTAYELPLYYTGHSEVYIYDIAIKPQYQRQGLGKKLIESLKNYCKQNNIKLFFVEANEEDTYAIDFYHSVNGQAEKVVHFNYPVL